uniref:Uncharacterized protein n=1 Tax=Macrostomum lignano TaxID=282301 RepID=A0A1I8JII3_9PLAT
MATKVAIKRQATGRRANLSLALAKRLDIRKFRAAVRSPASKLDKVGEQTAARGPAATALRTKLVVLSQLLETPTPPLIKIEIGKHQQRLDKQQSEQSSHRSNKSNSIDAADEIRSRGRHGRPGCGISASTLAIEDATTSSSWKMDETNVKDKVDLFPSFGHLQ